jgi:hypothetical protein
VTKAADAFPTASPSQKLSHNKRVQNISERGTPEELEAEVQKSQKFLETLKVPLASMLSVNKGAQYFAQQISQDATFLWNII